MSSPSLEELAELQRLSERTREAWTRYFAAIRTAPEAEVERLWESYRAAFIAEDDLIAKLYRHNT